MNYNKIKIKEKKLSIKSSTGNMLLDELLCSRNITEENEVHSFLNYSKSDFISPYVFNDMEKAVNKIKEAISKEEKILIWGDFDCDGVTSTSILYLTLKELNANVDYFIPDRLADGHGLSSKELLVQVSKNKVKLVITVDCGISNNSEVNLLKALGTQTIITDHHSTDKEIPNAFAIINPQVPNSIKENLDLRTITSLSYNSGSAIAYKLASALLNESAPELLEKLQLISSCGIIADVVPLLNENRSMVAYAIENLNKKGETLHKGIYRLLTQCGAQNITSTDIAFLLAPRINAVGRLASANLAFEFLTTTSETRINAIISELNNYNAIRQSKCLEVYEDAIRYIENNPQEKSNNAIILINKEWHIGIIGIVAAKIVEKYNKPCFLMTIDENNNARCSIRSNEGINVYKILKENENLFLGFGGHALAGGFSFNLDEIPFEKVKTSILETINQYKDTQFEYNTLYADLELNPDDINFDLIETINRLEPFGQNNENPIFVMKNVILEDFKTIGKENNHLRMIFSKENKKYNCVKWSENELNIPIGTKCDIAFYPKINNFNDIQTIQFEIVDVYSEIIQKNKQEKSFKIYDHRKKTNILEQISQYLKKDGLDIGVWAKTIKTKNKLSGFAAIQNKFINDTNQHEILMMFDYPSSKEELNTILREIKPQKLHIMNYEIDENIENYIKQLSGMLKYCANNNNGTIDIYKISQSLGVNENFIQICLEILEELESIEILDIDKINYIKAFNFEMFKNNSLFENLKTEFNKTIDFKKSLLALSENEFSSLVKY